MRIVYLHQYYVSPNEAGGTRSYEMARRWARSGHEVHVVTTNRHGHPDGPTWVTCEDDGFTVHSCAVPYSNHMSYGQRIRAFLAFALRAGPQARALRADVIFATSTPLTVIVPALVARIGRRTPIVFEVRDLWPDLPIAVGALRSPLLRTLARGLELVAYRTATTVVALSPGMAEGVRRRGIPPSRIVVAPNACDFERFAVPAAEGDEFRRATPWLGAGPLVSYCGTFGRINGVGYLARVAAEALARGDSVTFAAFGSGAEYEEVERLAAELGVLGRNFFLPGPVPKARVPALLSATTLCTSLFVPIREMEDNSANKFFDALAAGRPIAINYGGWQADLIRREGAGIILDPASPARAAEAIAEFVATPAVVAAAGVAAERLGRREFDREIVSARVLGAVEGAAASLPPRHRPRRFIVRRVAQHYGDE